jgi:hypothetical protein
MMVCKLQKTVSGSWAGDPNLPFLVCFYVVRKDVKLIDNNLLFTSVFASEINPRKPEPVGFRNQDSLLTIEHLENDPIRKVHPISQEAQLIGFLIELKHLAKGIVQHDVNEIVVKRNSVTGLSDVKEVWVCGVNLDCIQ